ncbi:MAG: response regulator [Lachnospiraceae bacterium]|nr:response regulator [Lachnospiraceae bacterium]
MEINKKRILVIDDDPQYGRMVREWLKDDYLLSLASGGEQAFEWLAQNTPDMILLDYEMPVMPGPQVLERLRDDVHTRDIPVLILTGKSDRESIMRIISLNPTDYLRKTIGREELLEKVAAAFRKNRK